MLDFLRRRSAPGAESPAPERPEPPAAIEHAGLPPFVFAEHVEVHEGFRFLRWRDVYAWLEPLAEADRPLAWDAVAAAWDEHLARGLGPSYRVSRGEGVVVVSSLEERDALAAVESMQRTLRRVLHTLDGVARSAEWGNEMLVILDDEETYYRFVSRFYPEEGEFAFSGGMKVDDEGCVYYVAVRGEVRHLEPVIAHEMAHGCVSHLPLPRWLDEGIAVNTEHRIVGAAPSRYSPEEMRRKHLAFWNPATLQEFWSGDSYRRPDEGNMLSYDLGRILVEQLAADWPRFAAFANAADWRDGGAAAARAHLGVPLGGLAAAFIESDTPETYEPRPDSWRRPEAPSVPQA